jgi:hypothetical protein
MHPHQPVMTEAERQKLRRSRQRDGLIVVGCVVVETDIIELLLAERFLRHPEPSRAQLSEALSRWIFRRVTRDAEARWNLP